MQNLNEFLQTPDYQYNILLVVQTGDENKEIYQLTDIVLMYHLILRTNMGVCMWPQ